LFSAATLALGATGCGQSDSARDTGADQTSSPVSTPDGPSGTAAPDAGEGAVVPTPGPDATPGCDVLTEPVFRLVHDSDPDDPAGDQSDRSAERAAAPEEVARLADGVRDNALSAVASRLSGLAAQPEVDDDAVGAQWAQFRQLCDLD
ncbi:MAG TPA: hypothetical protein H9878_01300, partial [Candidatus Dietzia merdigallinarum]|nr:hypothetical protein [Candidatus Dietzia merdigallinarum]